MEEDSGMNGKSAPAFFSRPFTKFFPQPFFKLLFRLAAAVSSDVFVVLSFDLLVIDRIGAAADKNSLAIFYSVTIAIFGLGCLLFPVSKVFLRRENDETGYFPAVMSALMIFLVSVSALNFSSTLPLAVLSSLAAALGIGYCNAWLFWSASVFLDGTGYTGRVTGVCILAAALALNFFSIFARSGITRLSVTALFAIAFVTAARHLWKDKSLWQNKTFISLPPLPLPPRDGAGESREALAFNKGLLSVAAVALMTVSTGISNGLFLKIYSAEHTYSMYFYYTIHGLSALFFGVMFDLGKSVYARLVPAVLLVIFAAAPLLVDFPPHGAAFFETIGWTYGGLFCLLYLTPFVELAPRTRFPELWASCGAITRYLVSGLVIIPTALLAEFVGTGLIAAINVALTALLLKTLSLVRKIDEDARERERLDSSIDLSIDSNLNSSLNSRLDEEPAEAAVTSASQGSSYQNSRAASDMSPRDNRDFCLAGFAEAYALTPVELKALRHVISSEESLKVISKKENISERTFQRYLTRIYEKTGTKTRAGLVAAYHKEILNTLTSGGQKNPAD